jgi:integrase
MPKVAFTDRGVASLRVATRQSFFDTKERGLCLRVSPQSTKANKVKANKSWWFVYRAHGKPQWLLLGDYPTITLAKARALALTHRRAVKVDGQDPAAEKRAAKLPQPAVPGPFTFGDLADLYEKWAPGTKKTWRADVSKLTRYLRPAWGDLPLKTITRAHVHELLDQLVANGMTVGVNRIQALISHLFTLALDRSLVDAHPAVRMMKRFKERPSNRVLTDAELRAFWQGLDAQPGRAADALRLRLLLGQRGAETAGMLWAEINDAARLWELPGARTKNGRPHTVQLSDAAVALLARRRQGVPEDEPRVFPGLTRSADDYRALGVIHGGHYEWKDLRRTVATRLASLGVDEATIGRLLNHARHTVTAKHYNQHAYLDEKRRALELWDRELTRILSNTPVTARTVVKIRRGTR